MLIEMMQKNTQNSFANYKPDNKNRKKYKAHGNRYSRENNNEKRKYCCLHKTSSHDNSECRKQNNTKRESKEAENKKINSLREPLPLSKTIIIPVKVENKEYEALFRYWVSVKLYFRQNIRKHIKKSDIFFQRLNC
ncbi:hypothetical protein DMUE_3571 [Dictyocoela muelleri]|nr:hypothetical protein DMUE_3571 [Dictyocoela muelleri]